MLSPCPNAFCAAVRSPEAFGPSGFQITPLASPVSSIPDDADVVVVHEGLAERARGVAPGTPIIGFKVFLGDPAVTKVVDAVKNGGRIDG